MPAFWIQCKDEKTGKSIIIELGASSLADAEEFVKQEYPGLEIVCSGPKWEIKQMLEKLKEESLAGKR